MYYGKCVEKYVPLRANLKIVCICLTSHEAKITYTVAEWLRTLIFSALNHSSSHRCGFEPSSGHI